MTNFDALTRNQEALAAFLLAAAGSDVSLLWCQDEPGCIAAGEAFVCEDDLCAQCIKTWLKSPYPDALPDDEKAMLRISAGEMRLLMADKDVCIAALSAVVTDKDAKLLQAQERIERLERTIRGVMTKQPRRIGRCVAVRTPKEDV